MVSRIGKNSRYTVVNDLGSSNRVKYALDEVEGKHVVIRWIPKKDTQDVAYVEKEILSCRTLYHHHIVGFREVFATSDSLCIVMDFAGSHSTLLDLTKKARFFSEDWARRFFQQIILVVAYYRHQGVHSTDIRLENMLLDSNQHMIHHSNLTLKQAYGDVASQKPDPYTPPECLLGSADAHDSEKIDVWRCGVCLYKMLFGKFPVIGERVGHRTPNKISSSCRAILSEILSPDPRRRPTIDSIFNNPWFRENLPEGTEAYNEHVKGLKRDVIERARKIQSEATVKRVIRKALMTSGPITPDTVKDGMEQKWFSRILHPRGFSLTAVLPFKKLKNSDTCGAWAINLVRKSITPVERIVHYTSS